MEIPGRFPINNVSSHSKANAAGIADNQTSRDSHNSHDTTRFLPYPRVRKIAMSSLMDSNLALNNTITHNNPSATMTPLTNVLSDSHPLIKRSIASICLLTKTIFPTV